jgi:hypothetical protein
MLSMHKVLIGLMTLVMPASLAAQKLTPGTWTGTISPPDQDALAASFVVRMAGDTTKLTLMAGGMEVQASDVKVELTRLLFSWAPGDATVKCTLLLRDDKSYSGDCVDDKGEKGTIVMKPPKP